MTVGVFVADGDTVTVLVGTRMVAVRVFVRVAVLVGVLVAVRVGADVVHFAYSVRSCGVPGKYGNDIAEPLLEVDQPAK